MTIEFFDRPGGMDMNKHTITYISPWRSARILGVIGLILGILTVPVVHMVWAQYTSRIWGVRLPSSTWFTIPLTAGALSFGLTLCACLAYNALVKRLGGIEFVSSAS
jgi:hypothetical protein